MIILGRKMRIEKSNPSQNLSISNFEIWFGNNQSIGIFKDNVGDWWIPRRYPKGGGLENIYNPLGLTLVLGIAIFLIMWIFWIALV